ncbi:zinc finger protein 2 homolog isoform X1 [Pieris rapae]|uniref:zinc finger protein 2 homolog isoform X1 n=1 Tax=Pieris rapae TaxID=64459 RepID=UPI001E27F02D|nr:zinc finger protein 2 homolog isoform X1 [Pieris rapae]
MEIYLTTNHEIIEENAYERCVCCNRIQNNLTNLSVCNFAYLIERLVDVKLKKKISKICCICHSILKRIFKFTKQLEASFGLDIQYTSNTNWFNLEKSDVLTVDTQVPFYQHNNLTEVNIKAEDIPKIKNELSDENESSHSDDNYEDLQVEPIEPLHAKKLQATSKCHKTVLPVTKKPRTQLEANYKGKIKIITISLEEVMKERKEEQLNKKYLRLPYKCEGCIVSFHYEHGLTQHLNKSHFPHKNGIKCTICSCIFPTQLSYDGHSRRHLKRYECIPCGKRSMAVYPLLKHYNEVHDIIKESYKCKRCNFVTTKYSEHRRHSRTHGRKAFCNLCDKTFANNTSLAVHVSSVHNTSNETFPCDECDKVYNKRASLLAHQRSHKPGFFYCDDCQRTFKSKAILSTHLKRHLRHAKDDAWRYKCNDCDEKFMVKRNLEDHINFEHLKIIKYVCDVCSKVFKTHRCLTRHVKSVHEKIRPPKNKICDYCGRGFSSTAVLKNHITTHTGERPHKCPYCSATFGQTASLYTHKKLVHKKNL